MIKRKGRFDDQTIVIVVVIAVLALGLLGGRLDFWGMGGMMGSSILGGIIQILVIIALVLLILWLARRLEWGRK